VATVEATPEVSTETTEAAAVAEEPSKAKRAREAADKARKGAAANRKLLEERTRLEDAARYQAQRTAELESRVQQADALIRGVSQDPLSVLKQLGVTAEQIAQRMAMEGSPEAKIQALEGMIAQERAERQKLVEQQKRREDAARQSQLETDYKLAAQNPKKYPNLDGVHPDFVLSRTRDIVRDLWAKADSSGYIPAMGRRVQDISDHELLSYLDSTYTKNGSASKSSTSESPSTSSKKTNTVTNRLQSATHAAPPDFSKMNDRQQRAWMAEQIRPLLK
jgi:hypothetical protein